MTALIFSLIILETIFNVAAQMSLKIAMDRIGHFAFTWENTLPIFINILLSYWIWIGIAIYVISIIIWLMILSRVEVSIAYPLISLGFIFNAIAAHYLLGEQVTIVRITGIVIILVGIFVVARS